MTGTEIALIITALATFTSTVGGIYVSLKNSRKLDQVRTQTDGMHKEVVDEVRKIATLKADVALKKSDERVQSALVEGVKIGEQNGKN